MEVRPARGAKQINRKGEYSRYEVVRLPRQETGETEVLLGVVSRRYQPLQNVEAFEFFDPIVVLMSLVHVRSFSEYGMP